MTKLITREIENQRIRREKVVHTTISGYSHECEVMGEGWEGGNRVYDLACGKWGWEEQVKFLEN
jgi:hypothetical protein